MDMCVSEKISLPTLYRRCSRDWRKTCNICASDSYRVCRKCYYYYCKYVVLARQPFYNVETVRQRMPTTRQMMVPSQDTRSGSSPRETDRRWRRQWFISNGRTRRFISVETREIGAYGIFERVCVGRRRSDDGVMRDGGRRTEIVETRDAA